MEEEAEQKFEPEDREECCERLPARHGRQKQGQGEEGGL